jgi:hypothetical protein
MLSANGGHCRGKVEQVGKNVPFALEFFVQSQSSPRILKDPLLDARVDKFYVNAMVHLSQVSDKYFVEYIERKMLAWYL